MKRKLSLFIALIMILGILPLDVFAANAANMAPKNDKAYEEVTIEGMPYKVYKVAELMDKPSKERPVAKRFMYNSVKPFGDPAPTEESGIKFVLNLKWATVDRPIENITMPVYLGDPSNPKSRKLGHFVVNSEASPGVEQRFDMVQEYSGTPTIEELVKKAFNSIRIAIPEDMRYDFILASAKWDSKAPPTNNEVVFTIEGNQSVMHGFGIKWYDTNAANRDKIDAKWGGLVGQELPAKLATVDRNYSAYFANKIDRTNPGRLQHYPDGSEYTPFDYYYNGEKITTCADAENQGKFDNNQLAIGPNSDRSNAKLTVDGKRHGEKVLKNNTKYFYDSVGDYRTFHVLSMREALEVKFNTGKGFLNEADKTANKANQEIGTAQEIGHSETIANNESGRKITVPDGSSLVPPAAEEGKPANEFIGWALSADATTALFKTQEEANAYATPFTGPTTFYAIYAPVAQGKVKIKYVDASDAEITDVKYHIDGQEYPAEKPGNKDEEVASTLLQTSAAPKFLGYEVTEVKVDGQTQANEKVTYTEDGKYTITYKYKKLADIIPAKDDNGGDNSDVTQDVKDTYKKVTIKVDSAKGKFQKNNADVTGSEFLYYVNPVEGKTLDDVKEASGLTPKSNDENANKIDANKPWIFTPDKTKADTPADVALDTEVNKDNFKGVDNVVMEVNFGQTKADQLKDKLDPVTIKVWVGDTITWKEGVKLNDANKDNETLKGLLAAATVTDLGENGTIDQPATARTSDTQNLPEGKKGNLKVAFDDSSALVVENQTLYVAPLKVPVKPGEENQIDPEKLPDDKLAVEFKLGEGVKIGDKNGDKTTPVLYETYYVKPGSDVKENVPTVTLKEGYKEAKWYKGDAEATDNDYKVTAKITVFTAKATGKDKVVKLDDPDNPTNFPKDPTDNNKKDADYVTVKFVADANGKIKENGTVKENGIAYAVLKNTEWADAVTAGVVVPTEFEGTTKFYTFKEWQKDGTKVTTFPKVESTDLTFTAVFGKTDELTVTYKLNAPEGLTVGGEAPNDDKTYVKDEKVTVKALAADNKLAGYKFTGWNTQADGKGTTYAADDKFDIKADTQLFAQWNKTAKDVIPVDNENDEKGKDGEEIPTNYVFVEFKVKDTDADKANIKDGQQAKFKVDPKATVTLTAPELEVKDAYKDSHTAKFNTADYTNKKFETATTIWASVSEKGKIEVKYVFETNPKTKTLPDALKALKPEDKVGDNAVYVEPSKPTAPNTSSDEAKAALIEKDADGKKVGEWKAGEWVKTTKDGNITYTLTWTFKEVDKPAPQPEPTPEPKPVPEPEFNLDFKVHEYVPTFPVYAVVENKEVKEVTPEIFTHEQYIFGYPDDTIRPDGDMTRAEAIAVVARLQKLNLSDKTSNIYKDTKAGMWYNAVINAAFREGYLLEKEGEDIRPNDKITRAELALLISHIDKKNNSVAPFEDVKGHKFEAAINQAYGNERIKGYPDGTFKPDNSITRAEVATMLNKLYDRNPDKNYIDANQNLVHNFKDMSYKGHWGYYELVEAYHNHKFARLANMMEEWKAIIK